MQRGSVVLFFSYRHWRGLPKGKAALGPRAVHTGSSSVLVFCSASLMQMLLLDVKQSFLDVLLRDKMNTDQSDHSCFRPRIVCSQNSRSFMQWEMRAFYDSLWLLSGKCQHVGCCLVKIPRFHILLFIGLVCRGGQCQRCAALGSVMVLLAEKFIFNLWLLLFAALRSGFPSSLFSSSFFSFFRDNVGWHQRKEFHLLYQGFQV